MVKNMALLRIDARYLAALLQLPEGTAVLGVRDDISSAGVLEIKVEGAGWPTAEGQQIMPTTGTVIDTRDATGGLVCRTVNWGFPASEEQA